MGEEYTKYPSVLKNNLYVYSITVGSIMLSLKDGETDYFIGEDTQIPIPLFEIVFNNLELIYKS